MEINITDYIIFPDGRVKLKHTTLMPAEYSPTKTGIMYCVEKEILAPSWWSFFSKFEQTLMLTGISLSAPCYIIIILLYSTFQSLRRVPSFILVSLSATLCLTDICMVILTTGNFDEGYKVLAIVLHFLLVVSLVWIIIIAYEYFWTFTISVQVRNVKKMRKFCKYLIINIFLPLIVISIMVTADNFYPQSVGYGTSMEAFIANTTARLIAYILPFILSYLFSLILLVITIFHLNKVKQEAQEVMEMQSKNINITKLALKLVVLLGVTDVVGIVQIPNPQKRSAFIFNAVFKILFTFERSFRGVFLWIMFVAKKDVMQIMKEKILSSFRRTKSTSCTEITQADQNAKAFYVTKRSLVKIKINDSSLSTN